MDRFAHQSMSSMSSISLQRLNPGTCRSGPLGTYPDYHHRSLPTDSTIVVEIHIIRLQPLRCCLLLSLVLSMRTISVLINCLCALACHGAWKESLGVVWCTYAVALLSLIEMAAPLPATQCAIFGMKQALGNSRILHERLGVPFKLAAQVSEYTNS